MKQSPAPQHHSLAALRWLPRLIQESCAREPPPTHVVSTIAATKIRIGDVLLGFPSWYPCRGKMGGESISLTPVQSAQPQHAVAPISASFCLSQHDHYLRFLRDVQGSVQIGIVKHRPKAGNHLSIGLRVIGEYTPDRPKHECKKCVAAPRRPHDGGRTDDVA